MAEPTSNDNEPAVRMPPQSDGSGHAAILLVESLLHSLIARSVITVKDAIEIVEVAAETEDDIAADQGDLPKNSRTPQTILTSISASLRFDHPDE